MLTSLQLAIYNNSALLLHSGEGLIDQAKAIAMDIVVFLSTAVI